MTDAPNRHNDTGRNKILIGAVRKLDEIINRHDPEIDVAVNAGVWNALDQLCHSLETAAERRGYARGIEAAVKKVQELAAAIQGDADAVMQKHPQIGEDRAEYADDLRDLIKELRALAELKGENQ